GFIPDSDMDQLMVQTETEQGMSFGEMSRYQQMVADIVRKEPAVRSFYSTISGGGGFTSGSNFGRMFLRMKPRSERDSLDAISARLRQKLSGLPFMRVYLQVPPTLRIGGQQTTAQFQYT